MKYIRLTITDTMAFIDNDTGDYVYNPLNSNTLTSWYRLPDAWLHGGKLLPEKQEALLRHDYGPNWRAGNEDGSMYVVLGIEEHELTPSEIAERPWERTHEACYAVGDGGGVSRVDARQF